MDLCPDPAARPTPPDMSAVEAAAIGMNCTCRARCSPDLALDCLYRASLEVLSRPTYEALDLMRPLAVVVGQQKTRQGQQECAAYAAALAAGDAAGALDACRRLIEQDAARAGNRQHRANPVYGDSGPFSTIG